MKMRAPLPLALIIGASSAFARPEPPPEPPDRTLEYVTFGASAAATVAAFGVWLHAYDSAHGLTESTPTPRRAEYAAELWGRQQMALGATLVGVGLSALTGWLAFRAVEDGPRPSAFLTPDGGVLGLRGRF